MRLFENTKKHLWGASQTLRTALRRLYFLATQPWRDYMLQKLIAGKRVLILGGGPSAKDLPPIPNDTLTFACNMSPAFLPPKPKNGKRHVDLYVLSKNAYIDYKGEIDALLQTLEVNILTTRNPLFAKGLPFYLCRRIINERFVGTRENYGYRRLTGKKIPKELMEGTLRKSPSSGVGLILYALIYGASEIYITGIDLEISAGGVSGGASSRKEKRAHHAIDESLIQYIANHYTNVFTVSPATPLVKLFPNKPLT